MTKYLIRAVSKVFPGLMVKLAYQKLTSPQVKKLRAHEVEMLDKSEKETLAFNDFNIQLYKWLGGERKILLIHGWEGQAGNFSEIIPHLKSSGFTVYAFDGPSHGFSSVGKTSLFEFTELVSVLIKKFKTDHLLSHSFGGVATTYALTTDSSFQIKRYALLTTPDKFTERINDVSEQVGITEKVKQRLIKKIEAETGYSADVLNVSQFVKKIKVEKALIIHDKNDRVIPISRSKNVHKNWPCSEFIEISGTGHFRILRTPVVFNHLNEFFKYPNQNGFNN